MNDFFNLLLTRQSCRDFSGKAVNKEDLLRCIEAGRIAPSACNAQPWFFYVVINEDLKDKVAEAAQSFNKKAGAFIVIVEEKVDLPQKIGDYKLKNYSQVDIGITASYICLAATQLGLATCMLGLFHEDKIKAVLNIPDEQRISLLISVGYAASKEIRKKQRKGINQILKYI